MGLRLLERQTVLGWKQSHIQNSPEIHIILKAFCKMLVWTFITVSTGAMEKYFQDSWIEINADET